MRTSQTISPPCLPLFSSRFRCSLPSSLNDVIVGRVHDSCLSFSSNLKCLKQTHSKGVISTLPPTNHDVRYNPLKRDFESVLWPKNGPSFCFAPGCVGSPDPTIHRPAIDLKAWPKLKSRNPVEINIFRFIVHFGQCKNSYCICNLSNLRWTCWEGPIVVWLITHKSRDNGTHDSCPMYFFQMYVLWLQPRWFGGPQAVSDKVRQDGSTW